MLNKLARFYIVIFVVTSLFVGCASQKSEAQSLSQEKKPDSKNTLAESNVNNKSEFSGQQLNYEIKKLNSEMNYLKEQIMSLDVKSSLYSDPFDIYNKEIMLNNGSSIFCKILSQNDTQIFVETLIGNLTIDRSSIVRIVENITVLDEDNGLTEIVEISQDEQIDIISDANLIKQRQMNSSASVILIEDIIESNDKSGNTILKGALKNIGTQRADLVRLDFVLRKNFQGDIETLSTYVKGSTHIFKSSGIVSNSSIEPGAIAQFKLIIPNDTGNFIGYSYQIEWDYYE
tara:strand:- start:3073 stop:3936 length:864 start_codon:yes stop_codon:yes gene_type:complete